MSGTFAAVNNSTLKPNHPLRVLMHPHQYMAISVNNVQMKILVGDNFQFVPQVFSDEIKSLNQLIHKKTEEFRIEDLDPNEDIQNCGMGTIRSEEEMITSISYPYAENISPLWSIVPTYVGSYIDSYYDNDTSIQADSQMQKWFKVLSDCISGEITHYVPTLSKKTVQKLISIFIFRSSIEYGNVGNILFNYIF